MGLRLGRGIMNEFDIIIVGAGSAGCVLADRLSLDGTRSVLVLEAGGSDRRPWVKLPIGYGKSFHDPSVNWRFRTQPDQGLDGRSIYWPRGKVLGGSSSINGLVYSRGLPGDYDDWAAAGNVGWDWSAVAPIFERIEKRLARDGSMAGQGGLAVADRSREYSPIKRFFLDSAAEIGLPDYDASAPVWSEGVGPYHLTTRKGLRCSAADVYLRPAMTRSNVLVRTGAQVTRLIFDNRRVAGVTVRMNGAEHQYSARSKVILSAGAVQSPQLLQLSGIGPAEVLQKSGIDIVHANDAVGGGLQDHLGVDYLYKVTEPTLNQALGTWRGQAKAALTFALQRKGPLSLSVNQMGGMVRSDPQLSRADIQLYFNPLSYTTSFHNKRPLLRPDPWPGINVGFNTCRPQSRGRVDIASPEIDQPPEIAPAYLSDPQDVTEALAGARLMERLMSTAAMRPLISGPNGFTPEGATDEQLIDDFRARASTVFHPCGTCAMGPDGVVDADCQVYGVDGLAVVDASIFPNITSANTNAPTLMAAHMAADRMLAKG